MTYSCDQCRPTEGEHCQCVFAACEWCSWCVAHFRWAEGHDESGHCDPDQLVHHVRPCRDSTVGCDVSSSVAVGAAPVSPERKNEMVRGSRAGGRCGLGL